MGAISVTYRWRHIYLRTTHRGTTYCVLIYTVDIFSAGITYEHMFQEETTTTVVVVVHTYIHNNLYSALRQQY